MAFLAFAGATLRLYLPLLARFFGCDPGVFDFTLLFYRGWGVQQYNKPVTVISMIMIVIRDKNYFWGFWAYLGRFPFFLFVFLDTTLRFFLLLQFLSCLALILDRGLM